MATFETKTFQSSEDVAVLLPDDLGWEADIPVTIERVGDVVTIRRIDAQDKSLEVLALIDALEGFSHPDDATHRDTEFPGLR